MNEADIESDAPAEPTKSKARFFRFAMFDLLLIMVVVGVWVAFEVNRQRIKRLVKRNDVLREQAGELVLADRSQIHARSQNRVRYEENCWRVFLPDGHRYRINGASREISHGGLTTPSESGEIGPGEHVVLLRHFDSKPPEFQVLVDGVEAFVIKEKEDWNPSGSFGSTGVSKQQATQAPEQTLVLRRSRVHHVGKKKRASGVSPKNDEVVNGLLLWIEHVGKAEAKK